MSSWRWRWEGPPLYTTPMPTPAPLSATAESLSALEGAALFEPTGRELVRVTGSERVSFLHGMLTCDVEGLAEGAVSAAALLNPKGALMADARLWRREGDLLLETGPSLGGRVREHLSRYLISEDAELFDATAGLSPVSLLGPKAAELAGAAVPPGRFALRELAGAMVYVAASLLPGRAGVDLLVPREGLAKVLEHLGSRGAVRASATTWEVLRVESGVPRYGVDMDEGTLLLEAGLEGSVSYQKGCYIGQEVVARATYRGQVQKKLTGVLLGDETPAPGALLYRNEKKVGHLTSVVRSGALGQTIALGYVHRDSLAAGTKLDLEGLPGAATVDALPFTKG
ncbi:MAG: CAF17-like 4Fe-4S cluster assembly/insertion protein YgfZ [Myxococcaceae bacterium]